MRTVLCILATTALLITSCKKDESNPVQPATNSPPTTPANPNPADGATGVSTSPVLSWTGTDPDGDSVKYELYFSSINPPNTLIASNLIFPNYAMTGLDSNRTCYWRVTPKDTRGAASPGPIWHFTTLSGSVPTQGLVAYYPFNGNPNDESGNGYNGTVVGAILTTDRFANANRAYSFDGYDDEIQVSHTATLNITGDITLSAWFNSIEAPQFRTHHTILAKRSSASFGNYPYSITVNYQYGIPSDYRKAHFSSAVNDTYQHLQSTSDVNINVWNHMVAVVSSNNLRVFINGVVVLNTAVNNQLRTGNTSSLLIGSGGRPDYPAERFKGQIDDVRIYNRALSETEIQQLYHEGGW